MRVASIESCLPAELPRALPLVLDQRPSKSSTLLKLLMVFPAGVAMLYPFLLIGAHAAMDPASRDQLSSPGVLAPVLLALAFWLVLFAWPLIRLTQTMARRRRVSISGTEVVVTEETLFGRKTWREPLSAFEGLAHHVRSSLSGVRHELILKHPDRDRFILVAMAPRFSQPEIDQVKTLLGQVEIPSQTLYRLPSLMRRVAVRIRPAGLDAARA